MIKFKTYTDTTANAVVPQEQISVGCELDLWSSRLVEASATRQHKVATEPWAGLCLIQALIFGWIEGNLTQAIKVQQKMNQQIFLSRTEWSIVWEK